MDGASLAALFYDKDYIIQEVRVHGRTTEATLRVKTLPSENRHVDNAIGRMLWDGEVELGRRLAGMDLRGRRVLEVGAGVGFAALCCWEAERVVVSDYLDDVVGLEKENVALNAPLSSNTHVTTIDWCKDNTALGVFDLVVGSEVFYCPDLVVPLLTTIRTLLAKDGRCLVINNVARFENCRDVVFGSLQSIGLKLCCHEIPSVEHSVLAKYYQIAIEHAN